MASRWWLSIVTMDEDIIHRHNPNALFVFVCVCVVLVVISEEEAADTGSLLTHFICLALSLLSIKQYGEELYDSRVEAAHQLLSLRRPPGSGAYLFVCVARKHPGGVASMTRDRGYPDWLVLSARLLWAGYHSTKYLCFIMFSCGYVKILQPVAMCTVIFVTYSLLGHLR